MTHTDFKAGDLITITKPSNTRTSPFWNEDTGVNMEYLAEGTHKIYRVTSYIEIWDDRIKGYWSLNPDWCKLVNETNVDKASPYYNVIRKSIQLSTRFENRKKGSEYAF
jgi:hypothetical protein